MLLKKSRERLETSKKFVRVDNQTIKFGESQASSFYKKTVYFNKFKQYLEAKNKLNVRLTPFYERNLFRRLKLGGYIIRKLTETRLLKQFKAKFHPDTTPADVVVAFGD